MCPKQRKNKKQSGFSHDNVFCRLMNGIIEYDQKLTSLPKFLLIRQISPKLIYWNIIFIITLIYYIAIKSVLVYLWQLKTIDITTIAVYFIRLEFIIL